jgi:hypothetical protein
MLEVQAEQEGEAEAIAAEENEWQNKLKELTSMPRFPFDPRTAEEAIDELLPPRPFDQSSPF